MMEAKASIQTHWYVLTGLVLGLAIGLLISRVMSKVSGRQRTASNRHCVSART